MILDQWHSFANLQSRERHSCGRKFDEKSYHVLSRGFLAL